METAIEQYAANAAQCFNAFIRDVEQKHGQGGVLALVLAPQSTFTKQQLAEHWRKLDRK